jgi:hypothetical protein
MSTYSLKIALDEISILTEKNKSQENEITMLKARIAMLELALTQAATIIDKRTIGDKRDKWMYDWGIIGQITEH